MYNYEDRRELDLGVKREIKLVTIKKDFYKGIEEKYFPHHICLAPTVTALAPAGKHPSNSLITDTQDCLS